jgi:hypothetical protein
MNTKNVTDRAERKKQKRQARAEAPAEPKRPADVPRGSRKRKVKTLVKGKIHR